MTEGYKTPENPMLSTLCDGHPSMRGKASSAPLYGWVRSSTGTLRGQWARELGFSDPPNMVVNAKWKVVREPPAQDATTAKTLAGEGFQNDPPPRTARAR